MEENIQVQFSQTVASDLNLTDCWVCSAPVGSSDLDLIAILLIFSKRLEAAEGSLSSCTCHIKYLVTPSPPAIVPIASPGAITTLSCHGVHECHLAGGLDKQDRLD